jgi:hypothetical protein
VGCTIPASFPGLAHRLCVTRAENLLRHWLSNRETQKLGNCFNRSPPMLLTRRFQHGGKSPRFAKWQLSTPDTPLTLYKDKIANEVILVLGSLFQCPKLERPDVQHLPDFVERANNGH